MPGPKVEPVRSAPCSYFLSLFLSSIFKKSFFFSLFYLFFIPHFSIFFSIFFYRFVCAVPHPLLNHTVKYCFSAHLQGRNVSKIAVIKTRMNLVYTTYRAAREERKRKADAAAADLIFSNQKSGRANRHVRHNLIRPSITERERERKRSVATRRHVDT